MLRISAAAAAFGTLTLLAGCSHQAGLASLPPDMGLYFNRSGQTASLAYGRANSDAVGLMLQCQAGSGQVDVSDNARSAKATQLTLTSGKARTDLPARVDASTGQPTLWAKASTEAPALRAFRKSGSIAVSSRGGGYGLTARAEEKARIERFFETCERA